MLKREGVEEKQKCPGATPNVLPDVKFPKRKSLDGTQKTEI